MKNLERAVRVFRALAESPVEVNSSTVRSWGHIGRAISHDTNLLVEMKGLPARVRSRVLSYVAEFSPLTESRPLYQFPGPVEAGRFVREIVAEGGIADRVDDGGLVSAVTNDPLTAESIAASHGGVEYNGPSLGDHFYHVDTSLPESLFNSGADPKLIEDTLVEAIYASKSGGLMSEGFVGIHVDGPLKRFDNRFAHFCQPKPVLGVPARLAEAVRRAGLATPAMLHVMEAGGAAPGVSPGGAAAAQGADDKGGIAKDQPAPGGAPANSRNGTQTQAAPPTEHVPTQEQGAGANGAVTMPDGTEIPQDILRQAFSKMLSNLATQVQAGTSPAPQQRMGAQPDPSVPEQQVAAQTASQDAAAQQGDEGAAPPPEAAGAEGEAPAPPQVPDGGEPPPAVGAQPPVAPEGQAPAEPGAEAPAPAEAPAEPGAPPAAPPAAAGEVDGLLDSAEAGDAEALKNAQGRQGEMTPEQKQRLQALLAQQQAAPPAPVAAQESYMRESRMQENLRDAVAYLGSHKDKVVLRGIDMVVSEGITGQPSKLVERILSELNALVAHTSREVRDAAQSALGGMFESTRGINEFAGAVVKAVSAVAKNPTVRKAATHVAKEVASKAVDAVAKKAAGGAKKESAAGPHYIQRSNGKTKVWTRAANVTQVAVLPEGLDYGVGELDPGTVVMVEDFGDKTSIIRLRTGEAVRIANEAIEPAGVAANIKGRLVEAFTVQQILSEVDSVSVVVGPPSSGKSYFIKQSLGRALSEGRTPAHLAVSFNKSADDLRESLAREDYNTLVRASSDRSMFESMLLEHPRFQHVREGRTEFLRDAIEWGRFRTAANRNGSGFDYFYNTPAVRSYYESVSPSVRESAERKAFTDAKSESIIVVKRHAIVDAAPGTVAEHVIDACGNVGVVEFRPQIANLIERVGDHGQVAARRAANAVIRQVREAQRANVVSSFVVYHEGANGYTAEGKIANNQIVKGEQEVEGDPEENKPKMRKDIIVRESSSRTGNLNERSHDRPGAAVMRDLLKHGYDDKPFSMSVTSPGAGDFVHVMNAGYWDPRTLAALRQDLITAGWVPKGRGVETTYTKGAYTIEPVQISKRNVRIATEASSWYEESSSRAGNLNEQLDTGQQAEAESCASGMKKSGELLKDARAAVFELTTSSLVQCASMAQATGAKKTAAAIDKAQQVAAKFLDDIKTLGDAIEKANETMKGENGGMGGDTLDQMQAAAAGAPPVPGAPAPAPDAMEAPAAAPLPAEPVGAVESVNAAIVRVMQTDIPGRIKAGEEYRSLNEAVSSYCPGITIRESVQVIDRIKAMTLAPEGQQVRLKLDPRDQRLLEGVARYGSDTSALLQRTRSGRDVLASTREMESAIRDLGRGGSVAHTMLARVLSEGIASAGILGSQKKVFLTEAYSDNERRSSGAVSWGKPYAGQSAKGSFKLNCKTISVAQAVRFAEETYSRFDLDVSRDLPNLAENFAKLKAKMKYGTVNRINMPVIEPAEIDDFVAAIEAGRVDIFAPWAKEHLDNLFPWQRSGNPKLSLGDRSWIELGFKDGDPSDDVVKAELPKGRSVTVLKPLQDEIWFDKLIATIIAFGPPAQGSWVTDKGVAIISEDNFIVDGHHRYGQIYLADPKLPMQVLEVPLKREKLLDITRAYGTAIGNSSKA